MMEGQVDKKISARDAALAAANFYRDATGYADIGTLEEVENKGDGYWYVTLGFLDNSSPVLFSGKKKYRVFKVSDKDGTVEYMKIRE